MSVIRPVLSANFFDIFEVDTFTLLQTPTLNSVANGGSSLNLSVTDPNSGADLGYYTYVVQRSVDGGTPVPASYQTGAIETLILDNVYTVPAAAALILPDGAAATTLETMYAASVNVIPTGVLATDTVLPVLFDTVVDTATGTVVVPQGTSVTVSAGTTIATATVPGGHTYAYAISVKNEYQTTGFSAVQSAAIASSFSAQTGLAVSITDNIIGLSWTDANTYAAGNRIEVWRQTGSQPFALISNIVKTSGAMPASYPDAFDFEQLAFGTTYSYRIRAVDDAAQDAGPFSSTVALAYPPMAYPWTLVAPTSASAVVSGLHVDLTWTDPNSPAAESGIYVYRDVGDTGVFSRIAVLSPGATVFADTPALVPGQVYAYKVSAFNRMSLGPATSVFRAAFALAVPKITSVAQNADVGTVVTWTDANALETSYTIQRSVNGGAYAVVAAAIPAGTTSYQDDFSEPVGTVVAYEIKAVNASESSAWSTPVQVVFSTQLVAPSDFQATIMNPSEVKTSFKNISPNVRGTYLLKSVNGSALSPVIYSFGSTFITNLSDYFPIVSGAVYAYAVQNYDTQGLGPLSPAVVVTTPFAPPQNLQIVVDVVDNLVDLSWITVNTAMDYTSIEGAFSNSGAFVEVARVPAGRTSATIPNVGGATGSTASFRIREIRQPYLILSGVKVPQNLGRYSLTVSTDSALSAPSGVTVVRPNPSQNLVSWTDSNTLATGFQVWRSIVFSGPVYSPPTMVYAGADPAIRSIDDTLDMDVGTTVVYWVYAVDADNSSPQSNSASLTARLGWTSPDRHPEGAMKIVPSQTGRTEITLAIAPPQGYSFVSGDQLLISRSVNGSRMSTLVVIPASASPTTYVDSAFSAPATIGSTVGYSARLFSATEQGPDTMTVTQVLYDAVFMPRGEVYVVRTIGSRSALTPGGNGVLSGCASGLVAITSAPLSREPVVSTSGFTTPVVSVQSGDLTRFVAATSTNQMLLVDAADLGSVTPVAANSTLGWSGVSNNTGLFDVTPAIQGASFGGTATGAYRGWTMAVQRGSGVIGVAPWNSAAGNFQNWDRTLAPTTQNEPFIALPFVNGPGASVQCNRLEAIGGDALVMVLQTNTSGSTTSYNTTLFQVQRGTNLAIEIFNIPNYVLDFVSDGVSRVFAVDISGSIWLIDMSLLPPSASSGYLGYNPSPIGAVIGSIPLPSVYVAPPPATPPAGHPGDLIILGTGMISIELGAGQVVATALHNGSSTTVHVFAIPAPPATLTQSLSLTKTYAANERIIGMAFDGGIFFYGRSVDTNKLFRFNAGL